MTTVYLYDPVTLQYQREYLVPKGLYGEDLLPASYCPIAPPAFDPDTQKCLWQNGAWQIETIPVPVLTLAEAQALQMAALYSGCQKAISSGFTSSALGSATSYPSGVLDQLNQHGAAVAGGQLQCAQAGTWALRQHTAAQAAQVVADFMAWANKCQAHLVTLTAQLNATSTVAAAQAVAWTNP